jgi:hypothetical protein
MFVDKYRVLCLRLGVAASVAGSVLAWPSLSQAEVHVAVGSRIEPYRYTRNFLPDAPASAAGKTLSAANTDFQTTALSPYLGVFFAQRYGLMLGVDLAWSQLNSDGKIGVNPTDAQLSDSFFQFGLALGGKLYLRDLKKDQIAPYIYVDIFKYFAGVSTNNAGVTREQASAQADMASPVGGTLAFGAEYFVGSNFSIGTEIFGLRISHVGGEYTDGTTARSAGFTSLAMYTGLTMNYRFGVGGSSRSTDDRDEERRRPAPPSAAPPPSLPPPTPEAID